jgi:hypothetical protein
VRLYGLGETVRTGCDCTDRVHCTDRVRLYGPGPCATVRTGCDCRRRSSLNTLKIIYKYIYLFLYLHIFIFYIIYIYLFTFTFGTRYAVARAWPHVSLHSTNCCSVQQSCSASNSKPRRRDRTKFSPFVVLLMTKAALKPYSPVGGYELPSSSEQTWAFHFPGMLSNTVAKPCNTTSVAVCIRHGCQPTRIDGLTCLAQ